MFHLAWVTLFSRIVASSTRCGELLRPKTGDCCVFCSYGSMPCPPVQVRQIPTCRPG
ncbi:MAG: GDCCVxC domain-containing (seleno)protein [Stellaceae bacterium]